MGFNRFSEKEIKEMVAEVEKANRETKKKEAEAIARAERQKQAKAAGGADASAGTGGTAPSVKSASVTPETRVKVFENTVEKFAPRENLPKIGDSMQNAAAVPKTPKEVLAERNGPARGTSAVKATSFSDVNNYLADARGAFDAASEYDGRLGDRSGYLETRRKLGKAEGEAKSALDYLNANRKEAVKRLSENGIEDADGEFGKLLSEVGDVSELARDYGEYIGSRDGVKIAQYYNYLLTGDSGYRDGYNAVAEAAEKYAESGDARYRAFGDAVKKAPSLISGYGMNEVEELIQGGGDISSRLTARTEELRKRASETGDSKLQKALRERADAIDAYALYRGVLGTDRLDDMRNRRERIKAENAEAKRLYDTVNEILRARNGTEVARNAGRNASPVSLTASTERGKTVVRYLKDNGYSDEALERAAGMLKADAEEYDKADILLSVSQKGYYNAKWDEFEEKHSANAALSEFASAAADKRKAAEDMEGKSQYGAAYSEASARYADAARAQAAAKKRLIESGIDEKTVREYEEYLDYRKSVEEGEKLRADTVERVEGYFGKGDKAVNGFVGALGVIGESAASVGSNLLGSLYTPVHRLSEISAIDPDKPFNEYGNAFATYTDAVRGTASENFGGGFGSELYGVVMSSLDSLAAMYVGAGIGGALGAAGMKAATAAKAGSAIGGSILGLSAAESTAIDVTARGGTRNQALASGTLAGLFESAFETVSIGQFKVLKESGLGGAKNFVRDLAKSGVVNYSEEANTEVADIFSDYLINGGVSQYAEEVKNGYFSGLSLEEAKKQAAKRLAGQVFEAGGSGALQGLLMGGIGSAASYLRRRSAGSAIRNSSMTAEGRNSKLRHLIEDAGLLPEGTPERRYADSLAKKYYAEGKLSDSEVGSLAEIALTHFSENPGAYREAHAEEYAFIDKYDKANAKGKRKLEAELLGEALTMPEGTEAKALADRIKASYPKNEGFGRTITVNLYSTLLDARKTSESLALIDAASDKAAVYTDGERELIELGVKPEVARKAVTALSKLENGERLSSNEANILRTNEATFRKAAEIIGYRGSYGTTTAKAFKEALREYADARAAQLYAEVTRASEESEAARAAREAQAGLEAAENENNYTVGLDNTSGEVYNGSSENVILGGEIGDGYGDKREDEFAAVQRESLGLSDEEVQLYHSGSKSLDDGIRERLSRSAKRLLMGADNNGTGNANRVLTLTSKDNNTFRVYENVDGKTFHDIFDIVRRYLKFGELVDLHGVDTTDSGIGYNECYNYLSEDGLSGFSITPDGDLISVFNASGKKGFLRAIAPIVKEKAKTLDCYASSSQNLMKIYSSIFGFKAASVMDYNMEYDHDGIAENHGMPEVAFMVNTEAEVETRHFGKDEYDEAVRYRDGYVGKERASEAVSRTVPETALKTVTETAAETPVGERNAAPEGGKAPRAVVYATVEEGLRAGRSEASGANNGAVEANRADRTETVGTVKADRDAASEAETAKTPVEKKTSVWNAISSFFRNGTLTLDIDSDGIERRPGIRDDSTLVITGEDRRVIRNATERLGVRVTYAGDGVVSESNRAARGEATADARDIRIFKRAIKEAIKAEAEAKGEKLTEKEINRRIEKEAVRVTYHEFGHVMEVYAPEAFGEFCALAKERYIREHGEAGYEAAVRALNAAEGRELEDGRADSEIACDMIPKLLGDDGFLSLFEKETERDVTAFGRFLNAVGDFLARVRTFFESFGHSERTKEETELRNLYISLRRAYNKASYEYRQKQKNGTVPGTMLIDERTGEVLKDNRSGEEEVRYSFTGKGRDGIRNYATDFDRSVSFDERKAAFSERIRSIFDLGMVSFNIGTKKITVTGDRYTVQKNIFGDSRSGDDGYRAKINALYDLADIFETSRYIGKSKEPSYNNPNVQPKNPAHSNVKYWYYFENSIRIDGEGYDVKFNIRDKGKEQYAYLVEFKRNEALDSSHTPFYAPNNYGAAPTLKSSSASHDNIISISGTLGNTQNVNKLQTIVNEGEKHSVVDTENGNIYQEQGNSEKITSEDIAALRSVGRKSVNDFTSEDIKKAEPFARRYFGEMGVKSPFFRAWFGDWREFDSTPVETVFVDTSKNEIPRGFYKNNDTNWNINVSSVGIKDTISHSGSEKLSVMAMKNVDDIVRKAVLLSSEVSEPKGKKGAGTLFMHKLYALTDIGGKQYISKLTVEEYDNGNGTSKRFYNLKEIKISPALGGLSDNNTASTMRISGDAYSVSELFKLVKNNDKEFRNNSVNPLMLNEDGTPKVVYHGTDAEFEVFDPAKGRANMDIQGIFFSPWEIDAADYGGKVGAYYINLKNPASEGTAYKAFNMFKGQNNAGVKAREYLIKQGYDGVNNSDEEYIAFYPEQVKSATDNIGTFDGENGNIYHSTVDTEKIGKDYREDGGAAENGKKISLGMSDEERAEVLKHSTIKLAEYKGNENDIKASDVERLKTLYGKQARKVLTELGNKFGTFDKSYTNENVDIEFTYSRSSLKESFDKQGRANKRSLEPTGFSDFAKMLYVFDDVVKYAVPIETHTDKYVGTNRASNALKQDYVLLGAFRDGASVVPVELHIKEFYDAKSTDKLYVTVTLGRVKIEESGITPPPQSAALTDKRSSSSPPLSEISIPHLISKINNKLGNFFKYLPTSMLSKEQEASKGVAVEDEDYRLSVMRGEDVSETLKKKAEEKGYTRDSGSEDGVYRNAQNNAKLPEPTYSDSGELIPLSERFNDKKDDIRYSTVDTNKVESFENAGESVENTGESFENAGESFENTGESAENAGESFENAGESFENAGESFENTRILPEYNSRGQRVSRFAETVAENAEYLKGTEKNEVGEAYAEAAQRIAEKPSEFKTEAMSHEDTAALAETARGKGEGEAVTRDEIVAAIEKYNGVLGDKSEIKVLSTEDTYSVLRYAEEARKQGLTDKRDELLAIAAENFTRSGRIVELAKVFGEMTGASYEKYMRRKEESINRKVRSRLIGGESKKLFDEAVKVNDKRRRLEGDLTKAKDRLAGLSEERRKAGEELARAKAELAKESGENASGAFENAGKLAEAEKKLKDLEGRLDESRKASEKAEKEAEDARAEIKRLNEELERLPIAGEESGELSEKEAADPELKRILTEEKGLKNRIKNIEKLLGEYSGKEGEAKRRELEDRIERLRGELSEKEAKKSELLGKIRGLNGELKKLDELKSGKVEAKLTERLEKLTEEYESKLEECSFERKRAEALEREIGVLREGDGVHIGLDELRRRLAETEADIGRKKKAIDEGVGEHEKNSERLEKLKKQLAELQSSYDNLGHEWETARNDVRAAKERLSGAKDDLIVLGRINKKLGANAPLAISPNLLEAYRSAGDFDTRREIAGTIAYELAKQVPHASLLERIDSKRHLNMLLNFKTPARNVIGNTANYFITGVNDRIAAVIEAAYMRKRGTKYEYLGTKATPWQKLMYSEGVSNYFEALRKKYSRRMGEALHPIRTAKGLLENNLHADGEARNESRILKFLEEDADRMQGVLQGKGEKVGDDIVAAFEENRRIFKSDYYETLRKLSNASLETPDLWFLRSAYKSSLLSALAVRRVDLADLESGNEAVRTAAERSLESAREYAVRRAKEVTFRESNRLSDMINDAKKNPLLKLFLDSVFPYVKTPANVAKQSALNSPIGFLAAANDAWRAVAETNGIEAARLSGDAARLAEAESAYRTNVQKAIENTARGFTGTALCFAGYMLSKGVEVLGSKMWLRFGGGDDDDYADLLGYQDLSVNLEIGGKKYSLSISQFSPSVVPLLIGALFREKMTEENKEASDNVLGALWSGSEDFAMAYLKVLCDTTMLSSFEDFLSDLSKASGFMANDDEISTVNAITSLSAGYLQQVLIPTYITHLSKAIFGSGMRSYNDTERDESGFYRGLQKRIINKFGGLGNCIAALAEKSGNETLERLATFKYVDEWGRTSGNDSVEGGVISISGGRYSEGLKEILRAIGVEAFMPFFGGEVTETEADKEILRLRDVFGSNICVDGKESFNIYPRTAGKSITYGETTVRLTAREYEKFAVAKGKTSRELIEGALKRSEYKALDDVEKAKVIASIYSLADKVAARRVIGDEYESGDAVFGAADGRDTDGMLDVLFYRNAEAGARAENGGSLSEKEKTGVLLGLKLDDESAVGIWRKMIVTDKKSKLGKLAEKLSPRDAIGVLRYYDKLGREEADSDGEKAEVLLSLGLSNKATEGIWKAHIATDNRIEMYDLLKESGLISSSGDAVKLFMRYPGEGYDFALKLKDEKNGDKITEVLGEKASVKLDKKGAFTPEEYNRRYLSEMKRRLSDVEDRHYLIKTDGDYLRTLAAALGTEVQGAKEAVESEMMDEYIEKGGKITISTSTGESGELSEKLSAYYWQGIKEENGAYKPSAALATYDKGGHVKYAGTVYQNLEKGYFDTKLYADNYVRNYTEYFNDALGYLGRCLPGSAAAESKLADLRKRAKIDALRETDEYYRDRKNRFGG